MFYLLTSEYRFQFLLKSESGGELLQGRAERVQLDRHELDLLLRRGVDDSAIHGNLGQIIQIVEREFGNNGLGIVNDTETKRRRGNTDELSTVKFDDKMSNRSGHVIAVGEVLPDGRRVGFEAGHAARAEVEVVFDCRHSSHERRKV